MMCYCGLTGVFSLDSSKLVDHHLLDTLAQCFLYRLSCHHITEPTLHHLYFSMSEPLLYFILTAFG